MRSKTIDAQRDSRHSTDSDGVVIRFINSNPYGNEGEVRRVSPSLAQRLVPYFAELATLPAKVDANRSEHFRRIQREVLTAAGLVESDPAIVKFEHRRDSQDHTIPALPVRIRFVATGKVVSVPHDLAIQRIVSGDAELAA